MAKLDKIELLHTYNETARVCVEEGISDNDILSKVKEITIASRGRQWNSVNRSSIGKCNIKNRIHIDVIAS